MSLKQIKHQTARIRTLALSDNVPVFEGQQILAALNQLERLCEEPEPQPEPQTVQNRADILNIVDQVWPDCPPDIRNTLGGPINACHQAGESVEEVQAQIKYVKAQYGKQPWTVEDSLKAGQRVQHQRKVDRRLAVERRNMKVLPRQDRN